MSHPPRRPGVEWSSLSERHETRLVVSAVVGLGLGMIGGWAAHVAWQFPAVMSGLLSGCLCATILWATGPWRVDGRPNQPGEGIVAEIKRQWSRSPG